MSDQLSSCKALIISHFQLPESELQKDYSSYEELETALAKLIDNLLSQDMPRLLNALYRIDLSEEKFKGIIASENPEEIGLSLAREIIKREIEKVKTREKYRGK